MLLERFLAEFSFDLSLFIFDIIIPCALAVVFGGLIGLQRERHERPAGLRTHAWELRYLLWYPILDFLQVPVLILPGLRQVW